MRLTYNVSPEDSKAASRTYFAALDPRAWVYDLALPIALTALGLGIYSYFTGNRPLAYSLWACAAYLGKGCVWRWFGIYARKKSPLPVFKAEIEAGENGIFIKSGESLQQYAWSDFRKFCETAEFFLIASARQRFQVVPKRFLKQEELPVFRDILRQHLPEAKVRTGTEAVRHTTAIAVLGFMILFFFGGTLQMAGLWSLRPLRIYSSHHRTPPNQPQQPLSRDKLSGAGQVYVIPFGDAANLLSPALIDSFRQKYRLELHVLPVLALPVWARDEAQGQLVAEEVIEAVKRAHPESVRNSDDVFIGVVTEDMYIAELDWRFAFNFRERNIAVISSARLNPTFYHRQPDPQLLEGRLQKLLTKNVGIVHYQLGLSSNPHSVLYNDVETVQTLDGMAEDYIINDAGSHHDIHREEGDPCISVRHYDSAAKQRKDSWIVTGCSATHGETDLETINIDLRLGLTLARHTDFFFTGALPLELSRVLRNADNRSRAFGIGGNHSLNIFPVGNSWPFSWIDLVSEDGGSLHYHRSNWGASYWDAVYRADRTISDFYDSTITWNWPGYKLVRQDGRTLFFHDGAGIKRPEQASLIGIQDSDGHTLKFQRAPSGNLDSVISSSGPWIHMQYDPQFRIIAGQDSSGRNVRYAYNEDGYLQDVTADGHVTHYSYDSSHRLVGVSVDGQSIVNVEFDSADRIVKFVLGDKNVNTLRYGSNSRGQVQRIWITDSELNRWQIILDNAGYWLHSSVIAAPERAQEN